MREALAKHKGKTVAVTARIGRYGADRDSNPTQCLIDISIDGEIVSDHMWVKLFKGGLEHNAKVSFTAKVKRYKKPSKDLFGEAVIDFRLDNITCVS